MEHFAGHFDRRYDPGMRKSTMTALMIVCGLVQSGCGEGWQNLTASFGGNTAGSRGSLGVVVINNTPHQAVFTLGTYDQSGETEPDFVQYTLDGNLQLAADDDGGVLSLDCARVVSLGGSRLLSQVESSGATIDEAALVEGIEFFSDGDGEDPASQGLADPFEVLLGVDYPCNALLIFKLEMNDSGSAPFRVDFELIPSESSR